MRRHAALNTLDLNAANPSVIASLQHLTPIMDRELDVERQCTKPWPSIAYAGTRGIH